MASNDGSPPSRIPDVKNTTGLSNVPEEIVAAIIEVIAGWSEVGRREEKEKGRVARSATLRAVALTSTRPFAQELYLQLLKHVTLDFCDIYSFYKLMERKGEEYGKLVETLQIMDATFEKVQRNEEYLRETTVQFSNESKTDDSNQLILKAVHLIFNRTSNLKSLIILNPGLNFNFRYNLGGNVVTPAFFNTLKTLHIRTVEGENFSNVPILARNVAWLMVFLPHLTTAAFGFNFDPDDLKFLKEYNGCLNGLSNVKELSLIFGFRFPFMTVVPTKRRTRGVEQLLRVTNHLEKLEIGHSNTVIATRGGNNEADTGCLSALYDRSRNSLREIRLLKIGPDIFNILATDYSIFESLRIMSGDVSCFIRLLKVDQDKLPPNLEVLYLPFYCVRDERIGEDTFLEEDALLQLVTSGKFSKLKEVVVPSQPINEAGEVVRTKAHRNLWRKIREEVEGNEVFRSGKIKFRVLDQGEPVDDISKKIFMSFYYEMSS